MKKQMKWRGIVLGCLSCLFLLLAGCGYLQENKEKVKDLEVTVLSEKAIPQQIYEVCEEKKGQPFQLTFVDKENMYICVGYGEKKSGGYSVVVDELYLTEEAVYVSTTLLGPTEKESRIQVPSYPYIVMQTEASDKPVIFDS